MPKASKPDPALIAVLNRLSAAWWLGWRIVFGGLIYILRRLAGK